jgi:hypothetical protein
MKFRRQKKLVQHVSQHFRHQPEGELLWGFALHIPIRSKLVNSEHLVELCDLKKIHFEFSVFYPRMGKKRMPISSDK